MAARSIAALKKRVQMLAAKGDDSMLELAEAMSELRAIPKSPDCGGPTIDELVDITKLSHRTINYLLKVWRNFSDLGISRNLLVRTGWTKLAVIAEHCKPADFEQGLTLADTYTAKELPSILKEGSSNSNAKARTVQLRFTPKEHEYFETVLRAHGAQRPKRGWGLSGKEQALLKAFGQEQPNTLPEGDAGPGCKIECGTGGASHLQSTAEDGPARRIDA